MPDIQSRDARFTLAEIAETAKEPVWYWSLEFPMGMSIDEAEMIIERLRPCNQFREYDGRHVFPVLNADGKKIAHCAWLLKRGEPNHA